jgi:hypothetical protein
LLIHSWFNRFRKLMEIPIGILSFFTESLYSKLHVKMIHNSRFAEMDQLY